MENNSIDFRKERDFGEIFSATFDFIKQEYKRFGYVILLYVLPFLVLSALLMILVQSNYISNIKNLVESAPYGNFSSLGTMMLFYLLIMLCYLIAQTMLVTATYSYIALYVKKGKDEFVVADVWDKMKSYFFPVLGANIVIGFIIGIGFVFCILPGIYLGISLSVILVALIFEGKGFSAAFSRSFELTKQDWWMTFLIVIIAGLLVYVLTLVIQIPAMIIGIGSFWTNIRESISDPEKAINSMDIFNSGYIIVTSISSVLTYVLYIIPKLILSFWYFSLVEKKEKPSLMEKIEQIGGNE